MADPDGDFRRDYEDGEEEELDKKSYKSQKDAIIMAIDVSESMLNRPDEVGSRKIDKDHALAVALKCAYHLMEQRIISNPKDMMGILFFGTEKSKFQQDDGGSRGGIGYPHCYLFVDLDVPAAADVKAVKVLAEDGEDGDGVLAPAKDSVAMSNLLFYANQIFTTKAANFGSRRLFIITDNDDPHANDKQAKTAAAVRAKDLFDLGVVIELFPIARGHSKFDMSKFYDDIIYRDSSAEANLTEVRTAKSGDGITLLSSLISNINSKQTAKRSLFSNLPFEIAPGLTISVNGYNILHRQQPQRSCYIWLDGDKPQIAVGETTRMAEDTARTVEKGETKKAYKFGGEYIYFTSEEQNTLRDFGKPALRIIGFKPRSSLPIWASVKKSTFIFPSEVDYVGSTRVFASLWKTLLRLDRIGIAWSVTRANANPRMVAIIPSREGTDNQSGTPYLPAGLWLYPLPFADDVRELPDAIEPKEATDSLKSKMRAIVQQLQLPKAMYNPTKYPNPSLQWHYRILQALALEDEVPDRAEDATEPKYKAISKRAGGYIEEWDRAVKQESHLAAQVGRIKREAAGLDDDVHPPAKKGRIAAAEKPADAKLADVKLADVRLSDAQVVAAAKGGGVANMTVTVLKDVLAVRGLSTAGKKNDLVDRVEQWADEKGL